MMLFGLNSDNLDAIASNFYINNSWIRFIDIIMNRDKSLLNYIPQESVM